MRLANYYGLVLSLTCLVRVVAVAEAVAKNELSVPSDEVIKSFVATAKEKPDSKTSLQFNVLFKPAMLPERAMAIYRSKGKIPFAISVELLKKIDTEEGQETQNIFEGAATIVVVDETGTVVSKKQEDMSALCPS